MDAAAPPPARGDAPRRDGRPSGWRRRGLFVLGCVLIVLAPLTAPLPGPGATLIAAGGLSLVLKTSPWAQRRYVRFKARFPKMGAWCDWGMRRPSHRRRAAIAKAAQVG